MLISFSYVSLGKFFSHHKRCIPGQYYEKTLDQELYHAKVTANKVEAVVANEFYDSNNKVMQVKRWIEERRFLQGEMRQLKDELAITERAAKPEAQLKVTFCY